MSLKVLTLAAESHTELPISPYGVGAIVLGLLLAALAVLLVVGRGRDHT